ncbi:hypothetical protein PCASD_23057 [Puccinia coronata f. sp. avenae]|uniref:HIT domain-containing protein n=1 Tax=Puccinia coronata f. sp. avenae TaxID=200324 RepID=A0A2N5SEG2_9BASI|nr:hypothetical protein PCASD_23057 [Puccinia coronata f. sp. avenae]
MLLANFGTSGEHKPALIWDWEAPGRPSSPSPRLWDGPGLGGPSRQPLNTLLIPSKTERNYKNLESPPTMANQTDPGEFSDPTKHEELIKSAADKNCIFCKIIQGKIPSFKIFENSSVLAFFDINPVSFGHSLVIPKYHGAKLHQLPDFALHDILPVAKKIAIELGLTDYNILQNNGRIAHQLVDHVHFHIIPKPSATNSEGLVITWPAKKADMKALEQKAKELKAKFDSQSASSASNL